MFINSRTNQTSYISKLSDLMYELLVHPGDAKERLLNNETKIKYILSFPVPESIKPIKRRILENLFNEKVSDPNDLIEINDFKFLFNNKRKATAAKIIKDLNSLLSSMKEYKDQTDV